MPRDVFLDTNGWFALLNVEDSLHGEADRVWRELVQGSSTVVLTDWIIAETGNGLSRDKRTNRFSEAVERVIASSQCEVVFVGPDLLKSALVMYTTHADKSWGLVDCASFTLMKARGITDAFTNDQHFRQAGFNCLLAADMVR